MPNLLKNLYDRAEEIKGPRLAQTLIAVFIVFLLIGIFINYLINTLLKSNEFSIPTNEETSVTKIVETTYEEGIIMYIDPRYYPNENISFYLANSDGSEIILLKADDQKLEVSEGLQVRVYGTKTKTSDGTNDVLIVDKLIVNR